MLWAILSDVHANLEALEAVLEDLAGFKPDQIDCLGDLVGYGPDPGACIDRIQKGKGASMECRLQFRGDCVIGHLDEPVSVVRAHPEPTGETFEFVRGENSSLALRRTVKNSTRTGKLGRVGTGADRTNRSRHHTEWNLTSIIPNSDNYSR